MQSTELSLVVSVFNEEEALDMFYKEITKVILENKIEAEIIFVNDGSTDSSYRILKDIANKATNVKLINFTRNYGHEAAMIAGIDNSIGDAVICMDSDLQHPPVQIIEMYKKFQEGFDVINMVRDSRDDAGFLKRITSRMFYRLLNKIVLEKFEPNSSDFFLISRRVAKVLKSEFRERTRFLRGYIQIMGYKKTTLNYRAPNRVAGESKYSVLKLLFFSISTIASFSKIPLRLGIITGLIFGILSLVVGIYSIVMKITGDPVSGYTTIVVLISFMFSILFIIIGIIGEYIGYLFDENKRRPIYLIEEKYNFEDEA